MKDFTTAIKEFKPSINDKDMQYFQMLKQQINSTKWKELIITI